MQLTARPATHAISEPLVIARGRFDAYETVEVSITWEGVTGHGEATPVPYFGESVADVVDFVSQAATLVGQDPFASERIDDDLRSVTGHHAAKAAIDAALHDVAGQALGRPVWQLLGLAPAGPHTSRTVPLRDPDTMARMAERETGRGFRELKLKLGGRDGDDLDRVRAVRSVTDLRLTVDINEYWCLPEALELLPPLSGLGVHLVEQPLPAGSPDGPELKRRSPLPIVADEDCHTLADVPGCVERAHGINIKLAKCGGIREAVRMVHAARALGLSVMIGCMGESSLGIAAAATIAALCDEVDLDGNLGLVADPWDGVCLIEGRQVLSDRPGLGVVRRGD